MGYAVGERLRETRRVEWPGVAPGPEQGPSHDTAVEAPRALSWLVQERTEPADVVGAALEGAERRDEVPGVADIDGIKERRPVRGEQIA